MNVKNTVEQVLFSKCYQVGTLNETEDLCKILDLVLQLETIKMQMQKGSE